MNTKYYECSCYSPEHLIKFTYDEEYNELIMCVFLNQTYSWYQRIFIGIKYVFGYKTRYGHFDSTIFKNEDIPSMIEMLSLTMKDSK